MAYLPKAMVERNIKIRVRKDKFGNEHADYEAYFGTDPFTNTPIRKTRKDQKKLIRDIADFYARYKSGGDAAVRISAMEAVDARYALDALKEAGARVSLYDAACKYIEYFRAKEKIASSIFVKAAYDEYYSSKSESADAVNVNARTGRWVRTLGDVRMGEITSKDIHQYMEENFGERRPKTYNSHLLYIKMFLSWCCKEPREYIAKNPARMLGMKPEPWKEPEYMKPCDVERLFRLLEGMKEERPDMLAYAITSFFCGCRAAEIVRMAKDPEAAKINIEEETVRIAKAKGYQQGKKPRAFHIEPNALAWMKSFDFLSAIKEIRKLDDTRGTLMDIYNAARENEIPVFHNCGRHTFITYHVAAYGDPFKTTAMVGTSDKMRADNYCGLASKKDGLEYFNIYPTGYNKADGRQ